MLVITHLTWAKNISLGYRLDQWVSNLAGSSSNQHFQWCSLQHISQQPSLCIMHLPPHKFRVWIKTRITLENFKMIRTDSLTEAVYVNLKGWNTFFEHVTSGLLDAWHSGRDDPQTVSKCRTTTLESCFKRQDDPMWSHCFAHCTGC